MQIITTTDRLDVHVGDPPVFDPAKPAEAQVEAWKAWSARAAVRRRLMADQDVRNKGAEPDKNR